MNLHISGDEKFIDFFIGDIERLGLLERNVFLIYVKNDAKLKYVKHSLINKIIINSPEWLSFLENDIQKYDRIYIHYFEGVLFDIVNYIPLSTKLIWFFYGNDGFLYLQEDYFLQKLSRRLSQKISNKDLGFIDAMLYPLILLNRKLFRVKKQKRMLSAFRRVDYFANFMVSDFELLSEKIRLNCTHIEITFVSLEALMLMESKTNDSSKKKLGNSILIGNSATITNNHLEIFEKIASLDINGRKIYCPLSYGNTDYGNIIHKAGEEKFGNNFIALRNFLSLDEYNTILRDCGFVFMNHERTQGAGNIIISLYSGAKVFLSNKSGIYHFMVNLGISVFSCEDDIGNNMTVFEPLSEDIILKNRELIYNYFNQAAHDKRLLRALEV